MSETSQGPGWWLASDGRWYPPDQRASSRTLVRPAGAGSSQGQAWWQASDGKWYPPALHPDVLVAPPPASGRRRRPRLRLPRRTVLRVLSAVIGAAVVAGVVVGLSGPSGTSPSTTGTLRDSTGWTLS